MEIKDQNGARSCDVRYVLIINVSTRSACGGSAIQKRWIFEVLDALTGPVHTAFWKTLQTLPGNRFFRFVLLVNFISPNRWLHLQGGSLSAVQCTRHTNVRPTHGPSSVASSNIIRLTRTSFPGETKYSRCYFQIDLWHVVRSIFSRIVLSNETECCRWSSRIVLYGGTEYSQCVFRILLSDATEYCRCSPRVVLSGATEYCWWSSLIVLLAETEHSLCYLPESLFGETESTSRILNAILVDQRRRYDDRRMCL